MPEQAADLGDRKLPSIRQVAGHIMPDNMEPKVADTRPFTYGSHQFRAFHIPGAVIGVKKHPFILAGFSYNCWSVL